MRFTHDSDASKRKFLWLWKKGEQLLTLSAFGDPVNGSTSYKVCVYDQIGGVPSFKMGATIGSGPPWNELGRTGWSYKSSVGNADGIRKLSLRAGAAGKPMVQMKGRGAMLPIPTPLSETEFFAAGSAVIVQLSSDTANCWSSTFDSAQARKNDGKRFMAQSP